MKFDILITDVDNTLYNFVDFFGPSFRAMVHSLSTTCKIPEHVLYSEFKDFFSKSGSIEHQTVIQNLPSISSMGAEKVLLAMQVGRRAFDMTRRNRLVPYSGLVATLSELSQRGVVIVGLTNAPLYQVIRRLRIELKIISYFSGLAGYVGSEISFEAYEKSIEKYEREFLRAAAKMEFLMRLQQSELKPDSMAFLKIREYFGDSAERIFALGDSVTKDLAPAASIGCTTIWAKYGTEIEAKNLETLIRITPWTEEQIVQYSDGTDYVPDYVIESPAELLSIIKGSSPTLF